MDTSTSAFAEYYHRTLPKNIISFHSRRLSMDKILTKPPLPSVPGEGKMGDPGSEVDVHEVYKIPGA